MPTSKADIAAEKRRDAECHEIHPDTKPWPVVMGTGRPLPDSLPDTIKRCRQEGVGCVVRGDSKPVNGVRVDMRYALEDDGLRCGARVAHQCCAAKLPQNEGE